MPHATHLLRDVELVEIDMVPIGCSLPEGLGFGSSREVSRLRAATLVRVRTRGGIEGWGECYGPPATTLAYLPILRQAYLSRPLTDHPEIWRRLANTLYHVRAHSQLGAAIAGLDIAMQDAWGKTLGVPLYRLWGGAQAKSVLVYASGGFFGEERAPSLEDQLTAVAGGFTAYKIKIGHGPVDDARRAGLARAILGDEAKLMLDMNGAYRLDEAMESMSRVERFDPWWIEEPLPPDDLSGYRRLAGRSRLRIAAGETAVTAGEMKLLADTGAVDVLMPDLHLCGGFLEGFSISNLARLSGLRISPHVWGGAVAQAAAAHFAAALPREPHPDLSIVPVEWDVSNNPLRNELLVDPLRVEQGHLVLPQGPGLGVEIDPSAVARLRLD